MHHVLICLRYFPRGLWDSSKKGRMVCLDEYFQYSKQEISVNREFIFFCLDDALFFHVNCPYLRPMIKGLSRLFGATSYNLFIQNQEIVDIYAP